MFFPKPRWLHYWILSNIKCKPFKTLRQEEENLSQLITVIPNPDKYKKIILKTNILDCEMITTIKHVVHFKHSHPSPTHMHPQMVTL